VAWVMKNSDPGFVPLLRGAWVLEGALDKVIQQHAGRSLALAKMIHDMAPTRAVTAMFGSTHLFQVQREFDTEIIVLDAEERWGVRAVQVCGGGLCLF